MTFPIPRERSATELIGLDFSSLLLVPPAGIEPAVFAVETRRFIR